jgi:hypothetical protein
MKNLSLHFSTVIKFHCVRNMVSTNVKHLIYSKLHKFLIL